MSCKTSFLWLYDASAEANAVIGCIYGQWLIRRITGQVLFQNWLLLVVCSYIGTTGLCTASDCLHLWCKGILWFQFWSHSFLMWWIVAVSTREASVYLQHGMLMYFCQFTSVEQSYAARMILKFKSDHRQSRHQALWLCPVCASKSPCMCHRGNRKSIGCNKNRFSSWASSYRRCSMLSIVSMMYVYWMISVSEDSYLRIRTQLCWA